jgi:hypothetical protein
MAGRFDSWSKTAASNSNSDATINWAEGQLPSTVNGSARAEMAALASFRDDINGSLTTAGSSNAYTITTNIAFTAYATGLMVAFKANHVNTGAATLNVNSIGAKALRTQDDAALQPGQIANNGQYFAKYDAAANGSAGAWLLQNPSVPLMELPRLLVSGSVSDAAALEIVLTSYTAYRGLLVRLINFVPATDAANLGLRVSTNAGASYNAGASDYRYAYSVALDSTTTVSATVSQAATEIQLAASVSNTAAEGGAIAEITIMNQTATGIWPTVRWNTSIVDDSGRLRMLTGSGTRQTAQDTDAVQFLFSSGNIASGTWALYGLP